MTSHHRHNATDHFVATELTSHRCRCRHHWITFFFEAERRLTHRMQQFTHNVGETHLYAFAPTRPDDTAGVDTAVLVYTVDDPTIISLTPNTGVADSTQANIAYLTAGTANVTVTGVNENGTSYTTSFQFIATVPPPPPNATDHFVASELN